MNKEILSQINQLEQQILIHSIIYYRIGESIWTDKHYDVRAKELQRLIREYPEEFKESILYDDYKEFDWTTGMNLPLWNDKYTKIATWLVEYSNNKCHK